MRGGQCAPTETRAGSTAGLTGARNQQQNDPLEAWQLPGRVSRGHKLSHRTCSLSRQPLWTSFFHQTAPSVPKLKCPSLSQGTGVGGFGSSLWERASECQPPGSESTPTPHPPSLLAVARGVGRVGQHHLEEEIQ